MHETNYALKCPMEVTIDLIDGKWKPLILWYLVEGTLRFNEMRRQIPQATAKMLTQQLRDLERDGLIRRVVHPIVPPKVEYSLTAIGESMLPVLDAMCGWGKDNMRLRPPAASKADTN